MSSSKREPNGLQINSKTQKYISPTQTYDAIWNIAKPHFEHVWGLVEGQREEKKKTQMERHRNTLTQKME